MATKLAPPRKAIPPDDGSFAALLRRHRTARRLSQLDLALSCDVSARHLSFLETGRASPSRDMVLQLADGLALPLGAQNRMMQAAGFAPVFPASPIDSVALEPFRAILQTLIEQHSPNPAMVCDRHWVIQDANPTARLLLTALQGESEEMNVIRMLTDNPAAEDIVVNYAEVIDEMHGRIQLEALEAAGDPVLDDLLSALQSRRSALPRPSERDARHPLMPLVLNSPMGELRLISTIAHFGTSDDVTVRDLRLELMFPADDQTREALAALQLG